MHLTGPAGCNLRNRLVQAVLLACTMAVLQGCAGTPPQPAPAGPAAAAAPPPAPPPGSELKTAFQEATRLMQGGQWHDAETRLQSLAGQYPAYPGIWVNLGITQVQLGNADTAEHSFRHALELAPQHAEAWNQLGMLYRRANRLEDAKQAWQAAIQAAPEYADAHWNLAILYDRYLPDPGLALAQYTTYRQLTRSTDPQLQRWIVTLEQQQPAPTDLSAGAGK
jgi:tetratricopeptide (TPR) repeat protein